jgi:hypothetical protein
MVRVHMMQTVPAPGGPLQEGKEYALPPSLARRLVGLRQAVALDPLPVETTEVGPAENAAIRTRRPAPRSKPNAESRKAEADEA